MIHFSEAQKILAAEAGSFGKEKIRLEETPGRTLAEMVPADRDYPPFNRSSMDGYAIRYTDFEMGARNFSVAETIYAGQAAANPLGPAQCYKIMTGAAVPGGADTVIRREDADETAGSVHIRLTSCRPFQNISRQGEDLRAGDMASGAACLCVPALVGLLASLGRQEVVVERLPRVALLTTGNEVVSVDAPVSPFQIRNSNRWLLQSFLKKWGIISAHYEHVRDDRPVLRAALAQLLAATDPVHAIPFDIIILSGGVSAGDADYVPGVLEELGVRKLFHKVAMKPGKPVWCGLAPALAPTPHAPASAASPASSCAPSSDSAPASGPASSSRQTMVFALPGNPFSCLVNFVLLIQPYLHACFGLPAPAPVILPLRAFKKKNTPLDEFFPVRTGNTPGLPTGLEPVHINGSGDIRLGLQADGLALHPAGQEDLPEGTIVYCYNL